MKVLEISSGTAAAYAGLLLAELGFTVDRLDLPARFPYDDDAEEGLRAAFLHRGKQTVEPGAIDITAYDALIEDVGRDVLRDLGFSLAHVRAENPQIALVSLSPFGLNGPYRDWTATDITAQAAGGVIHGSGFAGEAPRKLPGDAAAMIAGVHGATAAVSAVFARDQEGGVHIDISAQDTLMQHWTRHVADYAYSGNKLPRQDREPRGIHSRHTARAKDGWIFMLALRQPWQDVAAFLGLGDVLTADRLADGAPQPPWDDIEDAFEAAVRQRDRYDWFEAAADLGWTFAPVEDPWAVANGPQTTARGFMHDVEIGARRGKTPGLPYRFTHDVETGDDQ